jgi:5-methyltetrahydrofolate corrinoid/iron sulfur protein methyltransferase
MILVADNLQITNSKIEKALKELDPDPILEMVKRCEKAGADSLDINSGPLGRDAEKKMTFLVEAVQDASNLPILIDTANPLAMEAGLKASKAKTIINGFSLEPEKLETILPLAKKYETDIIGFLLYPNSHVPPDGTERLNIAVELLENILNAGIERERLIIDPVVAPVVWQNGRLQDMEILHVIRMLPELLDFPVRTIAGLSNLTTGPGNMEKKLFIERSYLPMLASSGLDMALLNIFHKETIRVAKACNLLMDKKVFSLEEV